MKIIAIAAMDKNRVIGLKGKLPWHEPADMARFSKLTKENIVLMGRKTWDSLPLKYQPLPNRKNVVLTRTQNPHTFPPEVHVLSDIHAYVAEMPVSDDPRILWVIGGANVYEETLEYWDGIELTIVPGEHEGDAFLPKFEDRFKLVATENVGNLQFLSYRK